MDGTYFGINGKETHSHTLVANIKGKDVYYRKSRRTCYRKWLRRTRVNAHIVKEVTNEHLMNHFFSPPNEYPPFETHVTTVVQYQMIVHGICNLITLAFDYRFKSMLSEGYIYSITVSHHMSERQQTHDSHLYFVTVNGQKKTAQIFG